MVCSPLMDQNFSDYFEDKTLRADYIFTGDAKKQEVYLDELSSLPQWAGRKHHLAELPLAGNGEITMKDKATGETIYRTPPGLRTLPDSNAPDTGNN